MVSFCTLCSLSTFSLSQVDWIPKKFYKTFRNQLQLHFSIQIYSFYLLIAHGLLQYCRCFSFRSCCFNNSNNNAGENGWHLLICIRNNNCKLCKKKDFFSRLAFKTVNYFLCANQQIESSTHTHTELNK